MSKNNITFAFGDIIEYSEEKYIFLVPSLHYVYLAKILSDFQTKQILKMREIHFKKGNPQDDIPAFWIVRLSCDDFKDQVASLARPLMDQHYSKFFRRIPSLKINEKDLRSLKEEILKKNMYPELKELVRDIDV